MTDTVGVASGLGEAFIQQKYKNNVSKGVEVSKINRGSGVLVVLRGSWRKGPGKGRSPAAARAPL